MCQVTLLAIFIRTVMMECLTSCPVSNNTFNDVTHSSSGAAAPAKKCGWLCLRLPLRLSQILTNSKIVASLNDRGGGGFERCLNRTYK